MNSAMKAIRDKPYAERTTIEHLISSEYDKGDQEWAELAAKELAALHEKIRELGILADDR